MYELGILAYGSLIDDPGKEILDILIKRIECLTPFAVEYARTSKNRSNAPTLVPFEDGNQVKAQIFILNPSVTKEAAENILYQRETRQSNKIYKRPADDQITNNSVLIELVNNLENVKTVLYTKIGSNIPELSADILAQKAIESAKAEAGLKRLDGITYLISSKRNNIQTKLSDEYEKQILLKTNTSNLEEAYNHCRKISNDNLNLNYPFKITPFANWDLTDGVFDGIMDQARPSDKANIEELKTRKMFGFVEYETGEKKMVFLLPVDYNGFLYTAIFPDPVLLYLELAHQQFTISEEIKSVLFESNSMKAKGQMRMLNSVVDDTNEIYNSYLQNRVCTIIMLQTAVEAFINSIIPDDIEYPIIVKKKTITLNKTEIERKLIFKDKLTNVVSYVTRIDLANGQKGLLTEMLHLYEIRNQFTHLKSSLDDRRIALHASVFNEMLNLDLSVFLQAVHKFIGLVKPNYIVKRL